MLTDNLGLSALSAQSVILLFPLVAIFGILLVFIAPWIYHKATPGADLYAGVHEYPPPPSSGPPVRVPPPPSAAAPARPHAPSQPTYREPRHRKPVVYYIGHDQEESEDDASDSGSGNDVLIGSTPG